MIVGESAQELLEKLWIAEEEEGQRGLPVADFSAEEMGDLTRAELVVRDEQFWTLTEVGRPEAAQAIRRHRLGERLLADVLEAEDVLLDEQACRLEHVLFDGLDESICTLLGHPRVCPHGKPIPPGACCKQMRTTVHPLIAALSELEVGQGGEVAYLQMSDSGSLQKIMAMGVLPGERLTLLRRWPSFVFECGYSQFAVDERIAANIYVRLNGDQT
jgi:DtxR family Mn-dependent transcriptional regulator